MVRTAKRLKSQGTGEATDSPAKWARQKGQALVELALILPLLLLLVFGIIEFGRALYIKNTLSNAAREGARRAAVTTPWTTAQTDALKDYVKSTIQVDQAGIVITISSAPNSPPLSGQGDSVTVNVALPFTPVVGSIIPQLKNITLVGQSSMRYEQ